jgi:hypothetical protein
MDPSSSSRRIQSILSWTAENYGGGYLFNRIVTIILGGEEPKLQSCKVHRKWKLFL